MNEQEHSRNEQVKNLLISIDQYKFEKNTKESNQLKINEQIQNQETKNQYTESA